MESPQTPRDLTPTSASQPARLDHAQILVQLALTCVQAACQSLRDQIGLRVMQAQLPKKASRPQTAPEVLCSSPRVFQQAVASAP